MDAVNHAKRSRQAIEKRQALAEVAMNQHDQGLDNVRSILALPRYTIEVCDRNLLGRPAEAPVTYRKMASSKVTLLAQHFITMLHAP